MKLTLVPGGNPKPMTDQDLADEGGKVDSRSSVWLNRDAADENTINAGQALVDVYNARRGKS